MFAVLWSSSTVPSPLKIISHNSALTHFVDSEMPTSLLVSFLPRAQPLAMKAIKTKLNAGRIDWCLCVIFSCEMSDKTEWCIDLYLGVVKYSYVNLTV